MKFKEVTPRKAEEVSNSEIFLWALHQLGGSSTFVDIEAAFVKCFEYAPNRFSWRTRRDLPDYKKCAKALRDAEAKVPALLIKTRDRVRRQLTVDGQKWIAANSPRLAELLEGNRVVQEPRTRPSSRLLVELERSEEFRAWSESAALPDQKWKVADVLRCSADSDVKVWNSRLELLKSMAHAAGKQMILRFLAEIEQTHPEWFAGVK